jgi:hypothetical protein
MLGRRMYPGERRSDTHIPLDVYQRRTGRLDAAHGISPYQHQHRDNHRRTTTTPHRHAQPILSPSPTTQHTAHVTSHCHCHHPPSPPSPSPLRPSKEACGGRRSQCRADGEVDRRMRIPFQVGVLVLSRPSICPRDAICKMPPPLLDFPIAVHRPSDLRHPLQMIRIRMERCAGLTYAPPRAPHWPINRPAPPPRVCQGLILLLLRGVHAGGECRACAGALSFSIDVSLATWDGWDRVGDGYVKGGLGAGLQSGIKSLIPCSTLLRSTERSPRRSS